MDETTNFVGETSDFEADFDDSENQGRRRLAEEAPYIKLKGKCKHALKELNILSNKYNDIGQILLTKKNKYQNSQDTISKGMYSLIRNLINMHVNLTHSLNDMKNNVMMKITHYDSLLSEINEAKNYYVDINAFNDVTGTHSSIYNIDTSTSLRPSRQTL